MDGAASEFGAPADFVGAHGEQVEGGLTALGFEVIRSNGLVTYWFNRETGLFMLRSRHPTAEMRAAIHWLAESECDVNLG